MNEKNVRVKSLNYNFKKRPTQWALKQEEEISEISSAAEKVTILAQTLDAVISQKLEDAVYMRECTMGGDELREFALREEHSPARAAEIVALRDAVVRGVEETFGIVLEQEPVMLGFSQTG